MTSRLPDFSKYDTLVAEAYVAFEQDLLYAVAVMESARTISKRLKKSQSNRRG